MRQGSLFCAGIWPFLFLPLLLLIALLSFMWRPLEQSVAESAQQQLKPSHNWATVNTFNRGRDVLLTGTAPSQSAVDQVRELVLATDGVNAASFAGQIRNPSPATLSIKFKDGQVILSGVMAEQRLVDQVFASAAEAYGPGKIDNRLNAGENIGPLSGAESLLWASEHFADGMILSVRDNSVQLDGEVINKFLITEIEKDIRAAFTGKVDNRLKISKECQNLINNSLRASRINFAVAGSDIQPASMPLLEKIAQIALRCPDNSFEVAGHTDSTGSPETNLELSQQRAQAVVDQLVELGLPKNRFEAAGYGSSRPVADNQTRAGRAANRRIEFRLKN